MFANDQVEVERVERSIHSCERELEYLLQLKQSYKYELGFYLKQIIRGNVDISFYDKSLIYYLTLIKRIHLIDLDIKFWQGLDKKDSEFLLNAANLNFKLEQIEGDKASGSKKVKDRLKQPAALMKAIGNKNTHFTLIEKLGLPNWSQIKEKINQVKPSAKTTSVLVEDKGWLSSERNKEPRQLDKTILDSGETEDEYDGEKKEKLLEHNKKKGFIIPSLEIRKQLEVLEKAHKKKIAEEMASMRWRNMQNMKKKLSMIYGCKKAKEIIHKYNLIKKI